MAVNISANATIQSEALRLRRNIVQARRGRNLFEFIENFKREAEDEASKTLKLVLLRQDLRAVFCQHVFHGTAPGTGSEAYPP